MSQRGLARGKDATERHGGPGHLSIVGTPIGNLEDMTVRGMRMLEEADLIACEDTRVTGNLLAHFEIPHKKLLSVHHHSSDDKIKEVIDAVLKGQRAVYVTDAGTPGMNDPGGKLVAAAFAAGIVPEPIPGASVLTTAISVCGFPMERFVYMGFLPTKKGRSTLIKEVAEREEPSVLLESTHRIGKALDELNAALDPSRQIYVGRELTKMYETNLRGTVSEVIAANAGKSIKGEFIIIVGPK